MIKQTGGGGLLSPGGNLRTMVLRRQAVGSEYKTERRQFVNRAGYAQAVWHNFPFNRCWIRNFITPKK